MTRLALSSEYFFSLSLSTRLKNSLRVSSTSVCSSLSPAIIVLWHSKRKQGAQIFTESLPDNKPLQQCWAQSQDRNLSDKLSQSDVRGVAPFYLFIYFQLIVAVVNSTRFKEPMVLALRLLFYASIFFLYLFFSPSILVCFIFKKRRRRPGKSFWRQFKALNCLWGRERGFPGYSYRAKFRRVAPLISLWTRRKSQAHVYC